MQQKTSGRYLDAYTKEDKGFAGCTVAAGYVAESFKWVVTRILPAELLAAAEAKLSDAKTQLSRAEVALAEKQKENKALEQRVFEVERRLTLSEGAGFEATTQLASLEQSRVAALADVQAEMAATVLTRAQVREEARCCALTCA